MVPCARQCVIASWVTREDRRKDRWHESDFHESTVGVQRSLPVRQVQTKNPDALSLIVNTLRALDEAVESYLMGITLRVFFCFLLSLPLQ